MTEESFTSIRSQLDDNQEYHHAKFTSIAFPGEGGHRPEKGGKYA